VLRKGAHYTLMSNSLLIITYNAFFCKIMSTLYTLYNVKTSECHLFIRERRMSPITSSFVTIKGFWILLVDKQGTFYPLSLLGVAVTRGDNGGVGVRLPRNPSIYRLVLCGWDCVPLVQTCHKTDHETCKNYNKEQAKTSLCIYILKSWFLRCIKKTNILNLQKKLFL